MKKMNFKKVISVLLFFSFAYFLYSSSLFIKLPTAHGVACGTGGCETGETAISCPQDCAWASPKAPPNVPINFDTAIMNLTNWILGFVAMIAVLAIIWGGVNYLTSAGNEDQAKTGKKVIQYALMGLVIAGIAYALISVIVTIILV